MNRLALAVVFLLCLAAVGCGSKEPDLPPIATFDEDPDVAEFEFPEQPAYGQGIRGFNEPFPQNYQEGIGLRAVTWDRWLAISVRNIGADAIALEPEAFRLIMPDRTLYAIGQDRHRMSLFTPTQVGPGQNTALIARLPEIDNLERLHVILNYPPRNVLLRVPIEPTPGAPPPALP
jgi:hypothetical protein